MKLTLVRHGEMAGDPYICPERPVQGCLSALGVSQAKALTEKFKNERFDKAYSSPYGRALQTAEIALEGKNLDIKILPFMHEWLPNEEYRNLSDEEWDALMAADNEICTGQAWASAIGEGYYDMCARIIPAFLGEMGAIGIRSRYCGYVPEEKAKDLSVIIFAHGGSLGVLAGFLLGIKPFTVSGLNFLHTGTACFDFKVKNGVYYPQLVIGQ